MCACRTERLRGCLLQGRLAGLLLLQRLQEEGSRLEMHPVRRSCVECMQRMKLRLPKHEHARVGV